MNDGLSERTLFFRFVALLFLRRLTGLALAFWLWFWAGSVGASGADQVRLAIYSANVDGEPLADVLTAAISTLDGVGVVERRELSKLVQEKSASGLSTRTFANAGTILRADGILILETRKVSKGFGIGVRLVSVRSGAVIAWWNQNIKAENVDGWGKDTALRLGKLVSKLQAKRLPAISFVGFNSPSSTREAVLLQRELNTLILSRVAAEPDLLVLERQKLLEAAFEKVLGMDDQKFWSGAHLLDGTINPTSIEPDAVAILARISSDGETREFTVRGKRNDLPAVAEQFVRELRRALKIESADSKQADSAAEAEKFLAQAENEVKWSLFQEARASADTAFALGLTDARTRKTRIEAYLGICLPEFNAYWREYAEGFGVIHDYSAPPEDEVLQSALELSYQLQDAFGAGLNLFETTNSSAMNSAIFVIGDVTMRYYLGAELRRQKEDKLAELRSSMRQFMDAGIAAGSTNKYPGETFELFSKYGPLWCETPEEGVKLLRRIRTAPNRTAYFSVSKKYLEPHWLPPLAGWKWTDRQRVDEVWAAFNTESQVNAMGTRRDPSSRADPREAMKTKVRSALLPNQHAAAVVERYRARNETIAATKAPSDRPLFALSNVFALATGIHLQAPSKAKSISAEFISIAPEKPGILALDYHGDELWVYFRTGKQRQWQTEGGGGVEYLEEHGLAVLRNLHQVGGVTKIPPNYFQSFDPFERGEIAAFSDAVILNLRDRLLRFDRKNKSFRLVEAPIKSASIFRAENRLFIKNAESILETTSALEKFEVVASVRRSPPKSPLDRLPSLKEGTLVHGDADRVLFSVGELMYEFENDSWKAAEKSSANASLPFKTFARRLTEPFTGIFEGRAFIATLPPLLRPDWPHTEFRFNFTMPGHWLMNSINVQLPPPGTDSMKSGVNLSSAANNLYLWGRDVQGLCLIRGDELKHSLAAAEAAQEKRLHAEQATIATVLKQYDSNQDGRLSGDELAAIASDPRLLNLVWSGIDKNSNNQIDLDELSYFDFNHDREFQPQERLALLNALAYLASASFLEMDADRDGLVSRKEGELVPHFLWMRYAGKDKPLTLADWTDAVIERAHRDFLGIFPPEENPFGPAEGFLSAKFLDAARSRRMAKLK